MAPTPPRAWFATAWAGHSPAASVFAASHAGEARPPRRRPRFRPRAPRPSPYRRPGVTGSPASSTPHSDGTIAATVTAATSSAAHPAPGVEHARRPRLDRVVLEAVGRGRHERRGGRGSGASTVPVGVGGHRLHRRRADVDADRHPPHAGTVVPCPPTIAPRRPRPRTVVNIRVMSRPVVLVTAPLRGPALDELRDLADVVLEPWIDQRPMRLYGADDARRPHRRGGRDDRHLRGRHLLGGRCSNSRSSPSARPAATRPTSTSAAATAAGIPVLHTPGRNADGGRRDDRRPAARRHPPRRGRRPRHARRHGRSATRSPTSATGPGSWPGAPPASSGSAPSDGRPGGGSRASACG